MTGVPFFDFRLLGPELVLEESVKSTLGTDCTLKGVDISPRFDSCEELVVALLFLCSGDLCAVLLLVILVSELALEDTAGEV